MLYVQLTFTRYTSSGLPLLDFAGIFFAAAFLAVAFFTAGFLTVAFLAAAFLGVPFFAAVPFSAETGLPGLELFASPSEQ